MGGIFKEVGLAYAKLFPILLASALGSLVIVGYLWIAVRGVEEQWKTPLYIALTCLTVAVIIHFPFAYAKAEDYCREQWDKYGSKVYTPDPPPRYAITKCAVPWPHGPDGLPGSWPSF